VGAYAEAMRRGVSFAGVVGASAGSILAALIGAGATPDQLEQIVSALDFRAFMVDPDALQRPAARFALMLPALKFTPLGPLATIWFRGGLHSSSQIEKWISAALSRLLPTVGRKVRFADLPIPTWVVATDIVSRDVKVWSTLTTPEDDVGYAVRCSCSIPGFFQPVDTRFVDGGVLSNLPAFVFHHAQRAGHAPLSTRILAFTLTATEEAMVPADTRQTARALIDTVVDGASNVQQRMSDVHVIDIPTGGIKATDFETIDADAIARLIENGRQATKAFFDDELARIRTAQFPSSLLRGSDEIYAAVTQKLDDSRVEDIWIVDGKTRWLYAIYPSLLYWLISDVRVTVVWQRIDGPDAHEQLRRRMLSAMGVRTIEASQVPFRGFLFDANDSVRGTGVVYAQPLGDVDEVHAIKYAAPFDRAVLHALQEMADRIPADGTGGRIARPELLATTSDDLISRLRRYVGPYAHQAVHLEVNRVPVSTLVSLSKVVKGFKYQQIGYLRELFIRHGLSPFQLAVVRYASGSSTILTPAVAERSGGQPILIQGNTRATYCYKKGIDEIDCVIARDVSVPLPSNQRVPIRHMLIGDRTLSTHDRYGADIDRDYRQIEYASHHPDITLV